MEDGVGHLFDHIDDLLNFPCDDDADVLGLAQEPPLLLLPPIPVPVVDEILGGGEDEKKAEAGFGMEEDKLVPCDELDIKQLEWMSKFIEDSDSFSLGLPVGGADKSVGGRCCFRTSSPVSVLGANTNGGGGGGGGVSSDSYTTASSSSSSSSSASYSIGGEKEGRAMPQPPPTLSPPEQPEVPVVPGRARSKRARPATFSPHPLVVITCLPPPATAAAATSDPESLGDSSLPPPTPPLKKKNKKKNPYAVETKSPPPATARKCAHCQIQKTPQWRAGPMGPKTLCNACGVRYKSGRLFPEYRPAASPTFVPTVHSNSHKKVVEMRIKVAQAAGADGCDLLHYIRRQRD
ncbi:GATA transcription factor 8-like [Zingiber officinale]|uniref:GATA-type domain-containing protein n=1 Tax=Zingiber officinale TaxID=94328 RepID=A0A8J5GI03_ZINOF|nr:GATA transcription factor 8-like [Zingiber officinale]XP_042388664.1 GATA transcription factor 8-like [Zingiber officinale]KAG6506877.1 hypothetical protein ZIOFF_032209 [Zingiber officinale]